MQLTPSQAFEHIKESVIEYLETAYKIAHPSVYRERGEILRQRGTIAQAPFIESTPAFPTGHKLAELERLYPHVVPAGLTELVQYGVAVNRFPLYTHQEEALLAAFSDQPHLLVASGTGSGKTESFLLPILADILREAQTWAPIHSSPLPSIYDEKNKVWLHSRRHEARSAALRCIILYPMNALVNDQLSRLRRILARGASPDWQREHLHGNLIHFGMYTSITQPTGDWREKWRRNRYATYIEQVREDWEKLREDLRETGSWPRPDSPEMLCRWDIQQAPPDILVTNYSMLEYMLARPVEYPLFERTHQWLLHTPDARFTLVLDEAHTYTGAKGTEVAYLVRRLKERLGIPSGSTQFRGIATSASIPNIPGADDQLRRFTADLFGETAQRFSLVRVASHFSDLPEHHPSQQGLEAFSRFHRTFDIQNPMPAIEELARTLQLGPTDSKENPQVMLHTLLEKNVDVVWVRSRTARNATLLDQLADECWGELGTALMREQATAGILAAGSFARPIASTDIPPLLSMRVHAFFRGISGIWACMNPECPEVPAHLASSSTPRPVGKIYMDPRPWCSLTCGARVLELFSCRHCGLLFLGGIPDDGYQSLWPWSDDLSGERQDLQEFRIFGVEAPYVGAEQQYRSIRTTLAIDRNDVYARPVYEVEPAKDGEKVISPFPNQCPRCQKYRQPKQNGREVIEPLRTRGPRSFSVIAEDGFRVQPRTSHGEPPNYGRKALLFTDSRSEAAQLAADLRSDHHSDLFRQLVYRVLYSCSTCSGSRMIDQHMPYIIGQEQVTTRVLCPDCQGTGRPSNVRPLQFEEIRARVIDLQLAQGINPMGSEIREFFTQLASGLPSCYEDAKLAFDLALRRELSEEAFALEPLGLAYWCVSLPAQTGAFPVLNEQETRLFLQSVTRILATEDILLPPKPQKPWDWPKDMLEEYERRVIIPGSKSVNSTTIPYNLSKYRKLGRYVVALSRALVEMGRFSDTGAADKWVYELHWPLWKALRAFGILQGAGAQIQGQTPQGIRIDSFELHPIKDTLQQCQSCAYIMRDALFQVCLRCGQRTCTISAKSLQNFYRRSALYALPNAFFDDPYPLRAIEHSAQIAKHEARDIERWFQDLFHDDQNAFDYRVDVLSVTTTMEMGIDIGSLLSVGLRNVPPNVASYQQRAGRAGRRGSAVATVLTFAQARSHDQYYFNHPPEIVSNPPRVPALYLQNEVIAHRHVRSLILQSFFHVLFRMQQSSGLFNAWGKIGEIIRYQAISKLRQYLATNRIPLLARCTKVVPSVFTDQLKGWMQDLPDEIEQVVSRSEDKDSLLEQLISVGLLPKYAFPVDVVSLSMPPSERSSFRFDGDEASDDETMERDLKIALAEYAPGAEVIRGSFPHTYVYRSVGVTDPFNKEPNYGPTGVLVECEDCQSVALVGKDELPPEQCQECQSFNVIALPYLRPKGFTVDGSLPEGGRRPYERGGRERAGYTLPARLLVGQTAFSIGSPQAPFAPNLYSYVRAGDLFFCNKGMDRDFPGFIICPSCGRVLDDDSQGTHTYPANVPPHMGKNRGPRAGHLCPNGSDFQNQVILGYTFSSEVILLGVDLPDALDAPFTEVAGKAVWYSFGTLLANAATLVLQINPGELKVGVRPVLRTPGRIHGEVFLYDDVPGGAGYARALQQNLEEILQKALKLGEHCLNPNCAGACYHCMYDYRNQMLHPLLDRELGTAVLSYLLRGTYPTLDPQRVKQASTSFAQFVQIGWQIHADVPRGVHVFPCVLQYGNGQEVGLQVIHPLQARPTTTERQAILAQYGLRCAITTSFDLERRPMWVMNTTAVL